MPVLRLRQEESKVLSSFEFGEGMIPCVEIVKERDRTTRAPSTKLKKDGTLPRPPKIRSFEEIHLPLLQAIKSNKILVDLPVHLKEDRRMKDDVLLFLRTVVGVRSERTAYLKKLAPLAHKIIPVISTYYSKTNELNSITAQERDLRGTFANIAFRTSVNTFRNDMNQIVKIAKKNDYLIIDLDDCKIDGSDSEIDEIAFELEEFDLCEIIMVKSTLDKRMTNVGLEHGEIIHEADNRLLYTHKDFGANAFGDYVGIKKDDMLKGAGTSPGFVYYDPTQNNFYGFRGSDLKVLEDFLEIIVPDVIKSVPTYNMNASGRPYLIDLNIGWKMLKGMEAGHEPSKSQAKFKRISMEHYLHCLRTKIVYGDFN